MAWHSATLSSTRRRLDRCPEAATRFANVDGAIMPRLDRSALDDAFAIGCVVVGIDFTNSKRPRRQAGAAGLVGFRMVGSVGSSLVADVGRSPRSGRGYSAG